jgi:hypothetical protein
MMDFTRCGVFSKSCAGMWSGLQQPQIAEVEEGVNIMLYPRTQHKESGVFTD